MTTDAHYYQADSTTESSDDHFSDASEGGRQSTGSVASIPVTRVERVDDQPSHGEVPGTAAYKQRTQDAVPDEVEIVPEGQRSRSSSLAVGGGRPSTPRSPGGTPVPRTIVEKVEPDHPSHGEVPGTAAFDMRKADAEPDEVVTSSDDTRATLQGKPSNPTSAGLCLTSEGEPTANHRSRSTSISDARLYEEPGVAGVEETLVKQPEFGGDGTDEEKEHEGVEVERVKEHHDSRQTEQEPDQDEQKEKAQEDDDFGDDFDDFEEGGDGDEDDFGDFGEAADEEPTPTVTEPEHIPTPPSDPLSHLVCYNHSMLERASSLIVCSRR